MKIVVVGCGKIGNNLIKSLVSEGHEVALIDNDHAVLGDAVNTYDILGVCGIGTDSEVLAEAGADRADLVIAVTGSDELNMLACYFAKSMGAKNTVARIRDREYNDKTLGFIQQHIHLSMAINPELSAAHKIYNLLKFPGAVQIESFEARKFEIIEIVIKEDSPIVGMQMFDLRKNSHAQFLVCAVMRDEQVFIPDGRFCFAAGDRIALTASPAELTKLLRSFGIIRRKTKDVMILGASRIAYYLAQMLLASGNNVTVIDRREERCRIISEALPGATVICGDGADQEMLKEEGIGQADAFVSLTGYDEDNILVSYFAASQKVPKVISKVNRIELTPIASKLGLDTLVSPTQTVTDDIVRYVRALHNSVGSSVEKLYKIMDGSVEALEFIVRSDFKHIGIPLKDIRFKQNVLIAGILRNRKPIVPSGLDEILPGDKVIVIATGHRLCDLSDIID